MPKLKEQIEEIPVHMRERSEIVAKCREIINDRIPAATSESQLMKFSEQYFDLRAQLRKKYEDAKLSGTSLSGMTIGLLDGQYANKITLWMVNNNKEYRELADKLVNGLINRTLSSLEVKELVMAANNMLGPYGVGLGHEGKPLLSK